MKKLTLILSAIVVVAFAGSAFANANLDPVNDLETDERYFVEPVVDGGGLISYMETLPQAFEGENSADEKVLLESSIDAGPNAWYTGGNDDA